MKKHLGLAGSCVVCLRGTDTGLAFKGEAEWIIAGLMQFGIDYDDAVGTIAAATNCKPGMVPAEEVTTVFRVCAECVAKSSANFPAPVLLTADAAIPCLVGEVSG